MTSQPPAPIREALIASVPVLIGRANGEGLVLETEGALPTLDALIAFKPGQSNLLDLFPDDAEAIHAALAGGKTRLEARPPGTDPAFFEITLIGDARRGPGAYFLVNDVTETKTLQIALLDCVDHEQMRVGRDLHDSLGQELIGLAYQLHAMRERLPSSFSDTSAQLEEQVAQCLRRTREVAYALSPRLSGEDLEQALRRLCAHVEATFGVVCEFQASLDVPLIDDGVAFHLFRITQEACTNAVRHGNPSRITVHLSTSAQRNVLEISDDGIGSPAGEVPADRPGMGLSTMKFRADAMGGSLRMLKRNPSGTTIRCLFENKPVPEPDATGGACPTCS